MFTAYFDASGTEKSRGITIAGFISHPERWSRFEDKWKSLLPPTVSMFHMTDFVSSRNGWEQWKGATQHRVSFFEALIDCIKSHTSQGLAISVLMRDYLEIDSRYRFREMTGGPYAFLMIACLGRLKRWAKKRPTNWRNMLCVFEDGDEGQADALNRARAEGFNAIPQSKDRIRAFDACDLAAWKARAMIDDAWERKLHLNDPASADRIMRSLSQLELIVDTKDIGMYSTKSLTRICEKLNIPRR